MTTYRFPQQFFRLLHISSESQSRQTVVHVDLEHFVSVVGNGMPEDIMLNQDKNGRAHGARLQASVSN